MKGKELSFICVCFILQQTIEEYHLLLHYVGFEVMSDSLGKFLGILSIPPSHLQRNDCVVSTLLQSFQICSIYNHPITAGPNKQTSQQDKMGHAGMLCTCMLGSVICTLKLHLSLICLFWLRSISTTSSPSRVLESPGVRLLSGAAT